MDLTLTKHMLFIGAQASGKSTVAKILAIFRDLEFVLPDGKDKKVFFHDYNINNFFKPNTYFLYSCKDYVIKYFDNKFIVTLDPEFELKIHSESERVKRLFRTYILDDIIEEKKSINSEMQKTIDRLYNANWKDFFNMDVEQTYIPAERILLSLVKENPFAIFANFALPEAVRKFGKKFEEAKSKHPIFPIDFLDITFSNENGIQKIYYDKSNSIDLSESASGFQYVVPMLLILENICTSVESPSFIIEEPELALYPTAQNKLVTYLFSRIQKESKTGGLILTTHSPYILSSINILILAYKIAQLKPELINSIGEVTNSDSWINPDDFTAFHFKKGKVDDIFNREINLISTNELDEISENIGGQYEELISLLEN